MADAWSTKPGVKPNKPDIASIIREAQNSTEHAGDAGLSGGVELDGTSFKHTDMGDDARARGGSTLGKSAVGTAALTSALTLHPCVHIAGCGDASKEVLHSMFSTVGQCKVQIIYDEESGVAIGEASATFASASAAEAAIRTYDGSRFDDGLLQVTVAQRAAQGSLTTRGKGKGRGKGGGKGGKGGKGGMAFSERQKDLISSQRLEQAQDEKDAFAAARRAQQAGGGRGGGGDGRTESTTSVFEPAGPPNDPRRPMGPMGPASSAEAAAAAAVAPPENASKKRKVGGGLPAGVLVVSKPAGSGGARGGAAAAPTGAGGAGGAAAVAAAPPPSGGGLLGLAGYGSDDDDDD